MKRATAAARKIEPALGALLDAHYKLYLKRKALEAKAKAAKDLEDKSEAHLFAAFETAKLEGARGRRVQASVGRREFVEIGDYTALCNFIRRKNAFDLLHRRVGIEALRERIAAGVKVPGVQIGAVKYLHLTAIKK